VKKKIISACKPYYDQLYSCNLEISPTPAIIKIKLSKLFNAFKSYKFPKKPTATVVKGGALGLSMTDFHEIMTFLNDAF
jgi:hypothetical protein